MKISISANTPPWKTQEFAEQLTYVQEAERMGADTVWTLEGWGQDAVTPLAYLAAKTQTIKLGTAIMQITARAPAMTAMTAMTLSAISEGRFILGLGSSGPQLVEGLHGQPFSKPLTRMKETVDIIRSAFAGEKLELSGEQFQLPLPGGQGKALRLGQPPNSDIPIYLATLGPKALEYTGQVAQGWIGTAFAPEKANAFLDPIWSGVSDYHRSKDQVDIHVGAASVAFGENLASLIKPLKMSKAFTLGAMGSKTTNYYNDAYSRSGWSDASKVVQDLWIQGRREEAAYAVPDEMVVQTNLLGTESMVKERLRAYKNAGVTALKISPVANDLEEKIQILGTVIDLSRSLS